MADDDSKWLEGVLGAASGEAPPPDMTNARCPKCGAQEFARISELYPEARYRIEDGESSDANRVGGMTDAEIVREFAPPARGSAVTPTVFVLVLLAAAAFYIYKHYGDNLGQIAAVAGIVITVIVFLTRVRSYSDKYYHARTRWNRLYMCRNCGQRVAG